jgi:hypothetical protein
MSSEPRRFRLTKAGLRPQDCTLHPDGTVTMFAGSQTWRSAFTFEEMQADWAEDDGITVEWEPVDEPVIEEPPAPAESLPLFTDVA